ncbi:MULTISPECIES: hypothetical protein [Thalassospira]|jgi:uncharacterized membrane protein YdjX (TVP38/TMEM64 family)|uniref:Uncharacterized protein n=1 Tax=Thalassospira povalilytica TaxID=732237 RepID=A0A8I1SKG9_9PROT|nr:MULTISPECIES: hypothetical protein [Thalassospira]MEE3044506.1 hypothetical protein [Pseudomonadota bacterium]RCK24968.1 hypothetical protein TH8_12040 [Thalassospira profundimaris]KZB60731.1 hypothetical protein AUQ42_04485 [Thalassospira sp. MCCC 1A02491]MAL40281.1 hypothetical protein [Thalassospira sp.]MBN8197411.1 hypothetical protein [Thalassospira povalilytica]|tara:strand:+ start:515 stop:745 length:231 start_codon:yes stop_codon:yes gene_type:complete
MEIGSFWGVVMIVVGAAAAMIVARVARRPFRNRRDYNAVQREKSFLHRPLNLIALLVALGIFVLGLFWKMTGGGPN